MCPYIEVFTMFHYVYCMTIMTINYFGMYIEEHTIYCVPNTAVQQNGHLDLNLRIVREKRQSSTFFIQLNSMVRSLTPYSPVLDTNIELKFTKLVE